MTSVHESMQEVFGNLFDVDRVDELSALMGYDMTHPNSMAATRALRLGWQRGLQALEGRSVLPTAFKDQIKGKLHYAKGSPGEKEFFELIDEFCAENPDYPKFCLQSRSEIVDAMAASFGPANEHVALSIHNTHTPLARTPHYPVKLATFVLYLAEVSGVVLPIGSPTVGFAVGFKLKDLGSLSAMLVKAASQPQGAELITMFQYYVEIEAAGLAQGFAQVTKAREETVEAVAKLETAQADLLKITRDQQNSALLGWRS